MRGIAPILFFALAAQAGYVNTEVVSVKLIKTSNVTTGLRLQYKVNDTVYDIPPNECGIKGAEFIYVMAVTGAQRKARVWELCRPLVRNHRNTWIANNPAPATTEEEDASNPAIGVLATEAP